MIYLRWKTHASRMSLLSCLNCNTNNLAGTTSRPFNCFRVILYTYSPFNSRIFRLLIRWSTTACLTGFWPAFRQTCIPITIRCLGASMWPVFRCCKVIFLTETKIELTILVHFLLATVKPKLITRLLLKFWQISGLFRVDWARVLNEGSPDTEACPSHVGWSVLERLKVYVHF